MENREIEILKRAQVYIESLANGINPLNGELVEDSDVINEVRISRCLFYVSKVLKDNIEKEENPKKNKASKIPFDYQQLNFEEFQFSNEPITITSFVDRINNLKLEGMQKLRRQPVYEWLMKENMLKIEEYDGKKYKIPTDYGKACGISYEEVLRDNGQKYLRTAYDLKAQKYILEHLGEALKR